MSIVRRLKQRQLHRDIQSSIGMDYEEGIAGRTANSRTRRIHLVIIANIGQRKTAYTQPFVALITNESELVARITYTLSHWKRPTSSVKRQSVKKDGSTVANLAAEARKMIG
eukprot:SAG31_NODE_2232_length_6139_cov_6.945199_4_plen_112_part_00